MMRPLLGLTLITLLAGCSGSAHVKVEGDYAYPKALVAPFNTEVALVLDDKINNYIGTPNKDITIEMGQAQQRMLTSLFSDLFQGIQVVESVDAVVSDKPILVVAPTVQEVQTAIPSQTNLNIYEVWIKYRLDVTDSTGEDIGSWFLPVYGKTPTAFLRSKEEALRQATIVALRDAGAKFSLEFHRIPSINAWMEKHHVERFAE